MTHDSPVAVRIRGTGLVALSVAARLARWDHRIELVGPTSPVPVPGTVLTLPAAWRDLAKKTGQPMAGLLNSAHLALVEAPPEVHHFVDGTTLALPTDRGDQLHALEPVVGRAQALVWAALLDRADGLWQALRRNGVERPHSPGTPVAGLLPNRTMDQLATEHSLTDRRLLDLWFSAARAAGATRPDTAPALLASRWSIERTFGRWHLVDSDTGEVQPLHRLSALLLGRLAELGVRPIEAATDRPATTEVDTHTPTPPALTLTDRLRGRRRPTLTAEGGWTIDRFRDWQQRPPLRVDATHWRGSAASHAGNEPWAQLLTGALIAYEVHEHLTGQDIRPTNRQAPLPPRLRPLPQSADEAEDRFGPQPE